MKVAIIGAGLSGCTAARILAENNNDVDLYEKGTVIGGLVRTGNTTHGRIFDMFGGHTFHTKDKFVWNWVNKFAEFRDYTHRKGIILFKKVFRYPLQVEEIQNKFPLIVSNDIFYELKSITNIKNNLIAEGLAIEKGKNFKEHVINMIGPTLYKLTVENYTRQQWGREPEELPFDLVPGRIEIRDNYDDRLFCNEFQGVPKLGYTNLCINIIKNKKIRLINNFSTSVFVFQFLSRVYDMVLCSAPVDEVLHGQSTLKYRGATFNFDFDLNCASRWEDERYGTINFSEGPALRKINFGVIYDQDGPIVTQFPSKERKYYPINVAKYNDRFNSILNDCCDINLIPFGRLGSFRYLNMDTAILTAMEVAVLAESWNELNKYQRKEKWLDIFESND